MPRDDFHPEGERLLETAPHTACPGIRTRGGGGDDRGEEEEGGGGETGEGEGGEGQEGEALSCLLQEGYRGLYIYFISISITSDFRQRQ